MSEDIAIDSVIASVALQKVATVSARVRTLGFRFMGKVRAKVLSVV